jgi:hypothetical protein
VEGGDRGVKILESGACWSPAVKAPESVYYPGCSQNLNTCGLETYSSTNTMLD